MVSHTGACMQQSTAGRQVQHTHAGGQDAHSYHVLSLKALVSHSWACIQPHSNEWQAGKCICTGICSGAAWAVLDETLTVGTANDSGQRV